MLYLHFLQLFHLVYKIGNKKSKSSYLFISSKCDYLRIIWNPWTEMCKKHLRAVNWGFENFCKVNKYKITLKWLPNNTHTVPWDGYDRLSQWWNYVFIFCFVIIIYFL